MDFAQINLKLPEDLKKQLEEYAKKIGITSSAVIKIAIKEYLNKGE